MLKVDTKKDQRKHNNIYNKIWIRFTSMEALNEALEFSLKNAHLYQMGIMNRSREDMGAPASDRIPAKGVRIGAAYHGDDEHGMSDQDYQDILPEGYRGSYTNGEAILKAVGINGACTAETKGTGPSFALTRHKCAAGVTETTRTRCSSMQSDTTQWR